MSVESTLAQFGVAEVIISLKSVALGGSSDQLSATAFDHSHLAHCFTRSNVGERRLLAPASRRSDAGNYRIYENLGLVLGTVDQSGWDRLKNDSEVSEAEEAPQLSLIRPVRAAAAAAASPVQGPTWGIQKLGIPELWNRGFKGAGVRIGHLDTGLDGTHPAFRKQAIAAFAEFDSLGNQVSRPKVKDSGYHGTHTAGTLVGRPVNGFEFGVAPEASLFSATVIEGGNIVARVLGGMNWCLGQKVQILNLSLGIRGYTPAFQTLIQALRNRGVLPIIAVGNEGPGTSRSPGNYENVLSVGAGDVNNRMWVSSSSHRLTRPVDPLVPDLVGPGSDVVSCMPGGGFQSLSGTSMATPHIAGLAALLWQAVPTATHSEIETAILSSCARPATMPQNRANRGIPDALKALKLLNPALAAKPQGGLASKKAATPLKKNDKTKVVRKKFAKKTPKQVKLAKKKSKASKP